MDHNPRQTLPRGPYLLYYLQGSPLLFVVMSRPPDLSPFSSPIINHSLGTARSDLGKSHRSLAESYKHLSTKNKGHKEKF